jgi:hypothetical protein
MFYIRVIISSSPIEDNLGSIKLNWMKHPSLPLLLLASIKSLERRVNHGQCGDVWRGIAIQSMLVCEFFRQITVLSWGYIGKVKVKESLYRPRQPLRLPGGWGSQIFRQGCQLYAPAAFTRKEIFLILISVRGWVDPSAAEGLCQWKISMTPSGFEPATFQIVAQCLD